MPKYLVQASYSVEGVRGILKEGGSSRRAVLEKLAEQQGGRLEAFYFAFGEDDVYAIVELPDQVTVAALSLTVASTGAVRLKTVVLLDPEEIDQAAQKSVSYRPPGG
jgi:uncharacterized protein with GYD domain